MKKTLSVLIAGILLGTSLLAGCSSGNSSKASTAAGGTANTASGKTEASGKTYTFRFSEIQPKDYPTTKAAEKFADMVKQKSNGRINIKVYYGGQLGDEKSGVEQLQYGGIDFTRASLSVLGEFDKKLNVLSLPYLFKDSDQMWKVLDSNIGDDFLKSVSDYKMVGLCWNDAGARHFYTRTKVSKLSDLKGLKIRVQESNLMMDMVKALGASPTPMAYGEVYSALQNGVIDGAENNWPSYESTGHYEVAKYLLEDGHNRLPEMVLCSQKAWNQLDTSDQDIIKSCAKEYDETYERKLWAETEKSSQDKVKSKGGVITELSDDELKKFQNAVQPLYKKYAGDYMDIVNKIQATK